MTDRRRIREEKLSMRRRLSEEERAEKSHQICQRLIGSEMYRSASTIFAFMSVRQEPDTAGIIVRALEDGKRVAIPKCIDSTEIAFYEITSLDDTVPGRFSIPEPALCTRDRLRQIDERTLVILPGAAFDTQGGRLGYGAGYYDRYLAGDPYRNKLMIAYSFQEAETIPRETHDIPVDWIMTEDRTFTVNQHE